MQMDNKFSRIPSDEGDTCVAPGIASSISTCPKSTINDTNKSQLQQLLHRNDGNVMLVWYLPAEAETRRAAADKPSMMKNAVTTLCGSFASKVKALVDLRPFVRSRLGLINY